MFGVQCSMLNVECFRPSCHPSLACRAVASERRLATRHSQRGVALIITLILLSVVTFMAIAFLALSRRERSAVATVTDTASARLAADAALANAEAQVIANVLATTNPYNFSLLVSTNFINPVGFTNGGLNDVNYYDQFGIFLNGNNFLLNLANLFYSPRPPVFIPTNSAGANDFRFYLDLNRNGRYDTNGWVTNLDNNLNGLGTANFQVGDPEWIGVLERPDAPYGPNNKFIARYAFIAVPVGNTLDLNAIHNQAQQGLPRLSGTSVNPSQSSGYNDVFNRNQGVGSWEINLAAFLADLNTNQWGQVIGTLANGNNIFYYYQYGSISPVNNQGHAFDDARALLAYRYTNNLNSLKFIGGTPAGNAFINDIWYIDAFSYGGNSLMTGFQLTNTYNFALISVPVPWVGADNTNHFFSHQDLFDPAKTELGATTPGFVERLQQAGTNVSTYDRYTFYRMLSQLGTDTAPESGKMNLNYDNLDPGLNGFLNTNGIASATNFIPWTPLGFFTNAADRLLRAYTTQWRNSNPTNFATTFYTVTNFNFINADQWSNYPAFGIGHIPVLVSNQFVYSSAVNRLLQLAANIYDATTTTNYPSVFRPTFLVINENGYNDVYINGYQQVSGLSGTSDSRLGLPVDVTGLLLGASTNTYPNGVNVYGVPWIIGAKKGFPNFNKFGMQNVVQIERQLQIARKTIPTKSVSDLLFTNQLYIFNISNSIGIECWNSYSNAYVNLNPNGLQIWVRDTLSMQITNDAGGFASGFFYLQLNTNITVTSWPGSAWNTAVFNSQPATNSFIVPINPTSVLLTNSDFYFGGSPPGVQAGFWPVGLNYGWETKKHDFQFPQFGLLTTNRLQVFMLDQDASRNYHVIDYVQFAGPQSSRNLNAEIQTNVAASGEYNMWSTALDANNVPYGIDSQINESDHGTAGDPVWGGDTPTVEKEIDGFATFMGLTAPYTQWTNDPTVVAMQTNYVMQVPFPAMATASDYTSWQANDPLVHYLASDLTFTGTEANNGPTTGVNLWTSLTAALPRPSFNVVNDRYQPWGAKMLQYPNTDVNPAKLAFKDPLVRGSDYWGFPANKFPTVGWLGRVHRGTPWQSVYLKASDVLGETNIFGNIGTNTWVQWTEDTQLTYGQYFDAANTAPVQDRLLFDLFTTAFNDNATRGTLSVNQNHLAAWSALFSGVVAITNNAPDLPLRSVPQYQNPPPSNSWMIIQPVGPYNPASPLAQQPSVVQLVQGINNMRANTNLFPLQSFTHVGDVLATPQLTEQSPFLHLYNGTLSDGAQLTNGISDEMYEWLPQQTMSLLRCAGSPRYVIYCYGQALKPAPNGIYTGGGAFFGMVTNYQIVSEIATRAVVRFGSTVTNVITYASDFSTYTNWFTVPVVTNNNAVVESFNVLSPD